jgi:hypothetical protein
MQKSETDEDVIRYVERALQSIPEPRQPSATTPGEEQDGTDAEHDDK